MKTLEESLSALIDLRGKSLASYVAKIFPDIVGKRSITQIYRGWFPLTTLNPRKKTMGPTTSQAKATSANH